MICRKNARTKPAPMAHSAKHARTLLSILGTMILFSVLASGARAQDRNAASASRPSGSVKIPVVKKKDIRFTRVAVNNVPIQASTVSIAQDQYGFFGSALFTVCSAMTGTI